MQASTNEPRVVDAAPRPARTTWLADGKANAQFIDSLFSRGDDTKIEQFDVLFPTRRLVCSSWWHRSRFTAKSPSRAE